MRVRRDLPSFLQSLHTDEFEPRPPSDEQAEVVRRAYEHAAEHLRTADERYWGSRRGTAAGLLALNDQFGDRFYDVPKEATADDEAANEALGGDEVVIDVQTHYVADRDQITGQHLTEMYRNIQPSWWRGLEGHNSYSFAEYLRCVFVETETVIAVLSSSPGVDTHRQLFNEELYATRRLLDELGGRNRLLNHSVVQPLYTGELESMSKWVEELHPAAWKIYTLGEPNMDPSAYMDDRSWRDSMPGKWLGGWMLDDDDLGRAFLDRVRELSRVGGPNIICAHKGISGLIDTGSPRDIGPAASDYPDLNFVVYHSGYEITDEEEGPYTEATADVGSNRLVKTLRDARIAPGANVYAELGSTWFMATPRPREAAHVLGKVLLAVGEDNVVWGSDSIWYGPTQQLIDSFRAFQIPVDMQEEFGYPALTAEIKEKILSKNAARLYGIDLVEARKNAENDDLAWLKEAYAHYRRHGSPA